MAGPVCRCTAPVRRRERVPDDRPLGPRRGARTAPHGGRGVPWPACSRTFDGRGLCCCRPRRPRATLAEAGLLDHRLIWCRSRPTRRSREAPWRLPSWSPKTFRLWFPRYELSCQDPDLVAVICGLDQLSSWLLWAMYFTSFQLRHGAGCSWKTRVAAAGNEVDALVPRTPRTPTCLVCGRSSSAC